MKTSIGRRTKLSVFAAAMAGLLAASVLTAADTPQKPAAEKPPKQVAPEKPPGRKPAASAEPTSAPTAAPADGLTLDLGGGVNMLLAKVPAGKFLMGSPPTEKARSNDEGPQHEVTISKPFYIGMFHVTQAQYQQIISENPSVSAHGPNYPVENVSWEMAVAFCKKLSEKTRRTVRLPTEAEFEYATRAGTTTRYYYGDDADYKLMGDYAWWAKNCNNDIHPVGLKKPNAWNLYDMYGNVWQWCSDWYDDTYPNEKQTDPKGPQSGQYRVMRGGCWLVGPHTMDDKEGKMLSRSALRGVPGTWYTPRPPGSFAKQGREYTQVGRIGFRVVVEDK